MAAAFTKYKKHILWVIAVIVVVGGMVVISLFAGKDQVTCTLIVDGERSSYRMNQLSDEERDASTGYWNSGIDAVPIEGTAIMEIEVPDDRDTLVVEERYHNYVSSDVSSTTSESYTLEKNENGKFQLQIGRRDQKKRFYDESAAYFITYDEKMYRIIVSFPALQRTLNQEYVSKECVFTSSLCAIEFPDDSGKTYRMTDDVFYITDDETMVSQKYAVSDWEWQEFPYTDEEWRKLCRGLPEEYNISEQYQERLYKPIAWAYWLLKMDGELWLASIHLDNNSEETIWSIYSLEPKE